MSSKPTKSTGVSLAGACCALVAALVLNYFAGRYAAIHGRGQPSLTADLLLNVLPHYNVQGLFVWGFLAFVLVAAGAGFFERRAAYIVWMYALLTSLRSFFIVLTPMGAPPGAALPHGDFLFDISGRWLTFGNDLFFSSHTSMPFLGFLVFERRTTRMVMLGFSIILAGCTLIGRYHYSIDVAAAFFITFALVQAQTLVSRGNPSPSMSAELAVDRCHA